MSLVDFFETGNVASRLSRGAFFGSVFENTQKLHFPLAYQQLSTVDNGRRRDLCVKWKDPYVTVSADASTVPQEEGVVSQFRHIYLVLLDLCDVPTSSRANKP